MIVFGGLIVIYIWYDFKIYIWALELFCFIEKCWNDVISWLVMCRRSVVSPIIDVISDETFEYITGSDMTWGGFNWKLNFRWYPVPQRELDRRHGDRSLPLRLCVLYFNNCTTNICTHTNDHFLALVQFSLLLADPSHLPPNYSKHIISKTGSNRTEQNRAEMNKFISMLRQNTST